MNLEYIANIAEIIGLALVVVTLIFLTVQIRQNTRAVRLNTVHGISESFRAQAAMVGSDKSVADVYLMGLSSPDDLDTAGSVQFYALMHNQTRCYEDAYYQWVEGALDDRYWSGMHGQMISTSSQPGFFRYWKDRRGWYSEAFQAHVDKVLIPNAKEFQLGGSNP